MVPRRASVIHAGFFLTLLFSRVDSCRVFERYRIESSQHTHTHRVVARQIPSDDGRHPTKTPPVEPTITVRPGHHRGHATPTPIDATHDIAAGRRMKLSRGRWIAAHEIFTSPLAAVAKVRDRWIFATTDGAVFQSEDFLSTPIRIGEVAEGALFTQAHPPSRGRLAIVDTRKQLWLASADGTLALAPGLANTRVVSARFTSESHGFAQTEWGRALETTDGGLTYHNAPRPRAVSDETDGSEGAQPRESTEETDIPTADESTQTFADFSCNTMDNRENDWLVQQLGQDACRSLVRLFEPEPGAMGIGATFFRWGPSVAVVTEQYRYAEALTRVTRDVAGRWHVGERLSVDGGASSRTRFSDDGHTAITIGRCNRDSHAEAPDELSLCWQNFNANRRTQYQTMPVAPRSRLVHGFNSIAVIAHEEQRTLSVLNFVANTTVDRTAATLAPTLREPRIAHVRTMLPSGRSYAVIAGSDGHTQLRLDLDRDDGTLVSLPRGAVDGAMDDHGRMLATGTHGDQIWRRRSTQDRWERVVLDVDASVARIEIVGVGCNEDSCFAGPFEIPWTARSSDVAWIGSPRTPPVVSEPSMHRWEWLHIACDDRNRIYTGQRIMLAEGAEEQSEGPRFLFGPGVWAWMDNDEGLRRLQWSDRYRSPTWIASGMAPTELETATTHEGGEEEQNTLLASGPSGLLVRFGATVAWISAGRGGSRVLQTRGAIANALVHETGFVLLREDGKISLYNLSGRVVTQCHNEQPAGALAPSGIARIAGRWGAITADPQRVDHLRFVDAETGTHSWISWPRIHAPPVCEQPPRPGSDMILRRVGGVLETSEQYVRRVWGQGSLEESIHATIEFENNHPCIRSIAHMGEWDEAPWFGTRGGAIPDSAIVLHAQPGQRLLGYDIARGDTALACRIQLDQGMRHE
ncbi:MAG: hypothetical protein Q8Q09_00715 [Deltaproteobacteria bacterium]|nr:hypothetical protein [Deltaproteobacteria bacterium]